MDNKIIIYKNDLRFKKYSKINDINDENFIFSDAETKNIYENNINLDSLQSRLEDCKKENYLILDLKYMDLTSFPVLPDFIYDNLRELYAGNNKFVTITKEDLGKFKKLQVLEIAYNNINSVTYLPPTLIELACSNNNITSLESFDLPYLKTLDCKYNSLTYIPTYPDLEVLICEYNLIKKLPEFPKIRKIICNNNKISEISNFSNIIYLDATKNLLTELNNIDNINSLIISHNPINKLPNLNKIKYLEITNTGIQVINFYNTLQEILCSKDQIKKIDSKYKLKDYKIHKNNLMSLMFKI